jgi:putative N6-adenine-specific DNA methylase
VQARDFAAFVRGVEALPWPDYAAGPVRLEVTASSRKSRLYHTGALEERVRAAVGRRLTIAEGAPVSLGISVRGERDLFTLSVDSSGERLHKRGWREETAKAPLRETLVAALLQLASWDPDTPLVDPLCGSGTIVLEAAADAAARAPGARRRFAFQDWPGYQAAVWEGLVAEATAGERVPAAALWGSDRDAGAIEAARRNAARAGLEGAVRFDCLEVSRAELPEGPAGLVLCNLPYGRRVRADPGLPRALESLARSRPGWRLGMLAPAGPRETDALDNGGVKVRLILRGPW